MRILALSLKNLNSLQGEWHIDFRHPAYSGNGIFAITGQTGAGKSTILDAICLALYGQTPRLGELTMSRNDLMSRQTGECWANVIFSAKGKTYLAEWSQKKAHNKHNGKLQSPKHSISDYQPNEKGDNQGNILEEKAKYTKPKIQTITGMDFQQFTRSMLLAQGSFAAFLQAKSEERSEILEQITGSEIYSEISIRVNNHRSEAKKTLDTLNVQQSGMMVLTAEEEQHLADNQTALNQESHDLKQQIQYLNAIQMWQKDRQATQTEQAQNQRHLNQLNQQISEFAPQRHRLTLAQKALEVASDYSTLTHNRQHHTKLLQTQSDLQNQLPSLNHQLNEQQQQLTQAKTAKTQAESDWETAQPKLNHAKKLAVQIDELAQQLYHSKQHHTAQLNEQIELANLIENGKIELDELAHRQNRQRHKQASLTNHATLPEVITNLRTHWQTLTHQKNTLTGLQTEQTQSQTTLNNLNQKLNQTQSELATFSQQTTHIQCELNNQTQQLSRLLASKTSDDWHAQANTLLQGKNSLSQIQQHWQTLTTLTQEKSELEQNLNHTQTAFSAIQTQNATLESDVQKQQKYVEVLINNQLLQAKIKNFEAERKLLRGGEACPLCGSTAHPFVTQTFEQNNSELQLAQHELKTLEKQRETFLIQQNSLGEKLQQFQQSLTKIEHNLINQFGQIKQLVAEFSQIFASKLFFSAQENAILTQLQTLQHTDNQAFFQTNFVQHLAELQQLIEQRQSTISQKIRQIQSLQHQINQLKSELETQSQQHYQLEKSLNDIVNQQAIETQKLSHVSQQIERLHNDEREIYQQIKQTIEPFNNVLPDQRLAEFSHQPLATLTQVIDTLAQCHHDYQQLEKKIQDTEKSIITLQAGLQQQDTQYQKTAITLRTDAEKLKQETQILTQRQAEKFALIGDMAIEQEEKRLTDNLTIAQTAYFSAEKTRQQTQHKLQSLQESLANISQELATLNHTLSQQHSDLQQRWQTLGFSDENAFLQANLTEPERQSLATIARQLDEGLHFLSSQQTALQQKYAMLQASPLQALAQGQTTEQIGEQLQQLNLDLENVQQQLGAISQKLEHNQHVKSSQTELISQIEHQTKIWRDWHNLHELIGSSDGKKFRNFAQGLTFNVMINHANFQLGKMNDRYLLVADDQNPLELNVIDNYQGGETRTSKNLSGGESFIVSLALALGLSSMASRQVQVDSLFLDEGFGTLDTEALDTALDTLTSLQQSGKLIGVISHVQELKDRITTQITVDKGRGGVSQIVGAGVKRVSK